METAISNKLWHSEYLSPGSVPQISSRLTLVSEADSAVFLDIPRTCENMADNNTNRYVWSHLKNITAVLDGKSNRMLPWFVSSLQPLLLLFPAVYNVACTTMFWPNYALHPNLFAPDQLLEKLLIRIFCFARFTKFA